MIVYENVLCVLDHEQASGRSRANALERSFTDLRRDRD
jgi:hypothetical protein